MGDATTTRRKQRPKQPTPLEAFELNMADAVWMVELAEALDNQRQKRAYRQTRERLGAALRMSRAEWDTIEVVESDDFFVIVKPGSDITRESLRDRTVLLRHALVAACAATETYFADKVIEVVRPLLHTGNTAKGKLPPKLREVPLDVGRLIDLDHDYSKLRAGLTKRVLVPHIERQSSVDPSALGEILGLIDQKGFFSAVDGRLNWPRGTCNTRMAEIAKRRNVIAHTGDRKGRGRNTMTIDEARSVTEDLTSIVVAAEAILTPKPTPPRSPDRSVAVHSALRKCSEPVTAAQLAEMCGAPRNTVAALLSKWSSADFDDERFPGVERVARGRYRYRD